MTCVNVVYYVMLRHTWSRFGVEGRGQFLQDDKSDEARQPKTIKIRVHETFKAIYSYGGVPSSARKGFSG